MRTGWVNPGGSVVHAHAALVGGKWPYVVCGRVEMFATNTETFGFGRWNA